MAVKNVGAEKHRIQDESGDESDDNERVHEVGDNQKEEIVIGTKETKDVGRLRLIVLAILVSSSIGFASVAYVYTRRSEVEKFEETFTSDANKVMEYIGHGLENIFGSLDMLATNIVSYERSSNETWPFVTIPNFPNRASKFLSGCNGFLTTVTVLVKEEDRARWEKYSWENRAIVNESLRILETDTNYRGKIFWDVPVVSHMQSDYGDVPFNET
jgi:hypothetical protein